MYPPLTRLKVTAANLLHSIYLVRYHSMEYLIPPQERSSKIVKVSVIRTIALCISTKKIAYRVKPRPFLTAYTGFRWLKGGQWTPGHVLENLEADMDARLQHQRVLLESGLSDGGTAEGTPGPASRVLN